MSDSLYLILDEHRAILQNIESEEGVLSEGTLNSLQLSQDRITEKAASYGYIIKKYLGEKDLIDAEIKRLTALKKSAENKAQRFKDAIAAGMNEFGIEKIKTATISMYFSPSKKLIIEDEDLIPAGFIKTKTEDTIDVAGIKAAIEKGVAVPGAYIEENKNLQIR